MAWIRIHRALIGALFAVSLTATPGLRMDPGDGPEDPTQALRLKQARDRASADLSTARRRTDANRRDLDTAIQQEQKALDIDKQKAARESALSLKDLKPEDRAAKILTRIQSDTSKDLQDAKSERVAAEAELEKAKAEEKAAEEAFTAKESAHDDFLGNLQTPDWMALYLLAGVSDLVKANTSQGSTTIKGASIELGMGNPSRWKRKPDADGKNGQRYPGYHLGGIVFTLLNSDPLVVQRGESLSSGTKVVTEQTYAAKSQLEVNYRFMHWNGKSQNPQERAYGLIFAGTRVVSDTNGQRTTTTGGTTTVESIQPPSSIHYTVWKAAFRYEFTYGSGYVFQGSFGEIGWLRDPSILEKRDRLMFRGRCAYNILGGDPKKTGRLFLEGRYLTGRGAQDRASLVIGYQANLTDVRKAMGF